MDPTFSGSLKDKRAVRQSLMAKLKKDFSLSVRETDLQDSVQQLVVSATFVCLNESEGEEYILKIQDFVYGFTLDRSCVLRSLTWDVVDVWNL
ncbi:DUF503 domain-containing protein [Ignavigranum ruoffiae]|uniref:DUF503 domain-containing protein n=1 Tax=Ignavigranum ruoffiae TaxID=89093 RepID=UPI00217DDF0D|nr:DUF503 domain-containing protein [Ignavigranum ruoffiae]UPQ85117.2 DUF503 domain-containing protein [Ignavigranum ruoffiae]